MGGDPVRTIHHNLNLSEEITDLSEDASDGDSYIMTINTSPKKRQDYIDHAELSNIEMCDWPMFNKDISKGMEKGHLLNKPSPPCNEGNKKETWSNEMDNYYNNMVGTWPKKVENTNNAKDNVNHLGKVVVQAKVPQGGESRSMTKGVPPAVSTPRTPRTPERVGPLHPQIDPTKKMPSDRITVTTPRNGASHLVIKSVLLRNLLNLHSFNCMLCCLNP